MFSFLLLLTQLEHKKKRAIRIKELFKLAPFLLKQYLQVNFADISCMDIPSKITCVDCGELAYLMTSEPEFGFSAGDWVAYRCSGCGDRWDLEVSEEIQDSKSPTS